MCKLKIPMCELVIAVICKLTREASLHFCVCALNFFGNAYVFKCVKENA